MNPNPRTYSATADELSPRWYVIDAKDRVLGRLASDAAQILRGKWKPTFTPHMLCGDYVIVINAAKVDVTRNRRELKVYFRHSQYPGGGKSETLRQALERHPERVIERAVRGMLPRNRLGDDMMGRLKVYPGERHPHGAQQPTVWAHPTAESVLAEQAEQEQKANSAQA
ncbi:MAG: 50S ribosomal protein L13 [Ktedonobacterales bacterium]|jgi:large subunit ribosomal protein L13